MVDYAVPIVVAILLGVVLSVTDAPLWIACLAVLPLVAFGCWWTFVRPLPQKREAVVTLRRGREAAPDGALTGNCPIREHSGDGAYVGRCEFACYDGVCPRHGRVSDYRTLDDRDVPYNSRNFTPVPEGSDAP
jgi:hypothetical protein